MWVVYGIKIRPDLRNVKTPSPARAVGERGRRDREREGGRDMRQIDGQQQGNEYEQQPPQSSSLTYIVGERVNDGRQDKLDDEF
jgi:hypothetical protein